MLVQVNPKTAQAESFRARGLHEAAIPLYREAIRQDDNDVAAWAGLGISCWRLNQVKEAEIALRVAIGLNPIHEFALFTLIELCMSLEKQQLAEVEIDGFKSHKSDHWTLVEALIEHAHTNFGECPLVWMAKGNLAIKKYQPKVAEKHFRKVLNKRPRDAAAWMSLGSSKMYQHETSSALECYRKAVKLEPNPDYIFNLGLGQLLTGDYKNGHVNYEASAEAYPHKYYTRHKKERQWKGQPCKKLLVIHAHGLGDLIFVSRLFKQLPPFVLECEWWQRPLFPGIETSGRYYTGEYDYWIGEDSLARWLEPKVYPVEDTIKLTESEILNAKILLGDKPAVSITWKGNATYRNDMHRSIPIKDLETIIRSHPEYQFINVSAEDLSSEICDLPIRQIQGDIRQSIAVLSQCKKIISVDTAHVHIGGTLGIPVLLMQRWLPDWRWGIEGNSPWYPSVKQYRQSKPGYWGDVIERISRDT